MADAVRSHAERAVAGVVVGQVEEGRPAGEVHGVPGKEVRDYCTRAKRWAQRVTAGEIPSSKVTIACAARFLRDLDRQNDPEWPYRFDVFLGNRACEFLEYLPHVEGPLAGELFRLEDWQCFVQANTWAWVRKTDGTRRFSRIEVWIPRGNGKSFFVSGNGTYALGATGEGGAQVAAAACTREQARIVLDVSRRQLEMAPGLAARLGLEVSKHAIFQPKTFSRYRALSSEAKTADGKNLYFVSCDELHAHPDRNLYDILLTGLGKRKEGTMFVVSTAGDNHSGIGYERFSLAKKIAHGVVDDDRTFVAIWEADEGDQWDDERTWAKANPNLGISVDIEQLRQEATTARTIASARSSFFTRRLNWWVSSANPFFNMTMWARCMDPDMRPEQFVSDPCVIGVDLATRHDFAVKCRVHWRVLEGVTHYYAFFDCWIPEEEVMGSSNASYRGWAADGWIKTAPGNELNLAVVEEAIQEDGQKYQVREVAYDPAAGGTQMAIRLEEGRGFRMVEMRASVLNFNLPMKELEGAHASGRLHVEASPLVQWMASNVSVKRNAKDEIFPRKEGDRDENKIDAITALILATNRILANVDSDPYQDVGTIDL